MSNQNQTAEIPCDIILGRGVVKQLIQPKDKDLGGFCVRRILPNQELKSIGPFIFFDHMGPATFPIGQGIDVRPHPHINIATVTYLFDGEILHRDSIGSKQTIRPGDLNLMVTGSGMVHSERESSEVKSRPHSVHGLQLWLALPEEDEETQPVFYHYQAGELPTIEVNGVTIRVMIGEAYGATSPVKTFSPTLYIEAQLKKGQSLELPNVSERGVYVVSGEVNLMNISVPEHTMMVLASTEHVTIKAKKDSQIALIGGDNLGKRYIDWNFVSSNKERVELAKQQWINGEFTLIEGDSEEFIPYPDFTN